MEGWRSFSREEISSANQLPPDRTLRSQSGSLDSSRCLLTLLQHDFPLSDHQLEQAKTEDRRTDRENIAAGLPRKVAKRAELVLRSAALRDRESIAAPLEEALEIAAAGW